MSWKLRYETHQGFRANFAVIDTVNTDVGFFEFDFEKTNTYRKIKEIKLPGETTDLLYYGYHGYKGYF